MCERKSSIRNKEVMSFEEYKHYISEVIEEDYTGIVFGGMGEPILHPKISEILRYTKDMYPELKIRLTTTCNNMNESIFSSITSFVDELKISHYANTETVFREVHGISQGFTSVCSWIKRLLEAKDRNCKITMNYLFLNENQVDYGSWLKKYSKYSDIDIEVWTAHNWGGNSIIPTVKGATKKCDRIESDHICIWCDGLVSVCCFDCKRTMVIGDMKTDSLNKILHSNSYLSYKQMNEQQCFCQHSNCAKCDQRFSREKAFIYFRKAKQQLS